MEFKVNSLSIKKGIYFSSLSNLLLRALVLIVSLLSVRILLPELGKESFGVLITIITLQMWLQLSDFGIHAAVNTQLAKAILNRQLSKRIVYQSTIIATFICVVVALIIKIAVFDCNYLRFFINLDDLSVEELGALYYGLYIFLIGVPSSISIKYFNLIDKGYIPNVVLSIGNMLIILGLMFNSHLRLTFTETVLLITFPVTISKVVIVALVSFCSVDVQDKNNKYDNNAIYGKRLISVAAIYTVLQLSGMLLFNTSVLVASFLFGYEAVTVLGAYNRLVAFVSIIPQIISPYLWSAYSKIRLNNKQGLMKRLFFTQLKLSLVSSLAVSTVLYIFFEKFILWWTNGIIIYYNNLLLWLLVWQIIISVMNPVGAYLNAHDNYLLQTFTSLIAGVFSLIISFAFAEKIGLYSIVMFTVISYFCIVIIPISLQVKKMLQIQ